MSISKDVGKNPVFVHGGGGNTSAKLDDRYMAVKASGYRLDQVTEWDGYVIVDYQRYGITIIALIGTGTWILKGKRRFYEGVRLEERIPKPATIHRNRISFLYG